MRSGVSCLCLGLGLGRVGEVGRLLLGVGIVGVLLVLLVWGVF